MRNKWPTKKLGEICEITTGSSNTVDAVADGKYAFFDRSKTIKRSNRFLFDTEALIIPGEGAEFFPRYYSGKFDLHQRAYALFDFNKDTDIKFVEYYLVFNHKYFERVAVGTTAKSLRRRHFEDLEIPLPPIIEQKQIAKTLDNAFEEIRKAEGNTEKNIQNSKDLFASSIQEVFTNTEDGWEKKKLREIADYFIGLTYSPKDVAEEGTIVLRSSNIQEDQLDFSDIVRVRSTVKDNLKVREGDILMCSRNGSKRLVGKTALIHGLKEEMTFGTFMTVIRSKYNEYLYWFFKSNEFRRQIGSGENPMINQVTKYMLDDLVIPMPPITEQKTITKKFAELFKKTRILEVDYTKKLQALKELRRSLLSKAFSGKLGAPASIKRTSVATTEANAPSAYIRNQVHAAIIDQVNRDGGWTTEVAVAKYDHLLQEVFGLSLGYEFQTHQFGPFDAKIKRLVSSGLNGNKWFTKKSGMIIFGSNIRGLLFRQSHLYKNAQAMMQQLSRLGITKLDAEKIELLSTVCHSMKKTDSVALDKVRDFMSQWKTDNNTRTKAEKFTPEETQRCLDFIIRNNLHQRLLQT